MNIVHALHDKVLCQHSLKSFHTHGNGTDLIFNEYGLNGIRIHDGS